ncbi:MAG: acyl-CoA dehydrogenase family protein, partial [Solirubrobacteraceae bacterium]
LLAAHLPRALGGEEVELAVIARGCFELARHCGASAMVFAMHQIQVATMARHLDGSPWFSEYLHALANEQRLVASVTSEVGTGGDLGMSIAAIEELDGGRGRFEKQAPTVSYGAEADDLLTTVRRRTDAEPGDQVCVLTKAGQHTLETTGTWDPLGMRGTCSPGATVRAQIGLEQVLATPFSKIMHESMVPISHILWSHLWLGIATDAFDRSRAFVRASGKRTGRSDEVSLVRLSELMGELALLRAEVAAGMADFTAASANGRERLSELASVLRYNTLKLVASEKTAQICERALTVCGIMGYKNDSPYSVGRHLRDALSAGLMVSNDRIRQTNGSILLVAKEV